MVANLATVHVKIEKTEPMPSEDGMYDLLFRLGLATRTQECFWVIAYDAAMNIRTAIEIGKGSYAKVPLHLPSLYTAVLAAGCDRFQIAHNHPTGNVVPTEMDIKATHAIMEGANALGLYFEDHWIVGPTGLSYSFRKHGLLVNAPYTGELNA